MSEPANCREYAALHQRLGAGPPDRLLDVACGAGLAVELAAGRGAACAGIDASARLVAIARDRSPHAGLRAGDMHALPWADATSGVVTSFRGIWGTTPGAVAGARRVLRPQGRPGITAWGHRKQSPGAWALAPFALAGAPKVQNQAAMVALGRPAAGEDLLAGCGFAGIERIEIPSAREFAGPHAYARAPAPAGPAYEAIQDAGEDHFRRYAIELAHQRIGDGLPLRAQIAVAGYLARKPARPATGARTDIGEAAATGAGFPEIPAATPNVQRSCDADAGQVGLVMNVSRLRARQPSMQTSLSGLLTAATRMASLSLRQRGILVAARASTLGGACCSLAWGKKLADQAGADAAAGVLRGEDDRLEPAERVLARWARQITRDPSATRAGDVQALREAGCEDGQIFAITVFAAIRVAFCPVSDALGARPGQALAGAAPAAVRNAVTFGRPAGAGEEGPAAGTVHMDGAPARDVVRGTDAPERAGTGGRLNCDVRAGGV